MLLKSNILLLQAALATLLTRSFVLYVDRRSGQEFGLGKGHAVNYV